MSKMIEGETSLNSEVRDGKMVSQPILEEGVFRFDCSEADRNRAYPSVSFVNPKVRETPLANVQKLPAFVPSFECVQGQQIVNLEVVSSIIILKQHIFLLYECYKLIFL